MISQASKYFALNVIKAAPVLSQGGNLYERSYTLTKENQDHIIKDYPYEEINCADCGGSAISSTSTMMDYIDNKELIITNIPVLKCNNCGMNT